ESDNCLVHMLTACTGSVLGWAVISGVLASSYNFRNNWFSGADAFRAFHFLHDKSDLCGIGLFDINYGIGGYAHLHRDVPLIIPAKNNIAALAYNYALASPQKLPDYWPYAKIRCWSEDKLCVYHRDGPRESVQWRGMGSFDAEDGDRHG